MTQKNINVGSSANKGDGDPLRTAFDKINDNFTELYAATGNSAKDISGSIFGDDSTLLVDAVNSLIPSSVLSGDLPAIDGSALTNLTIPAQTFASLTGTPTTLAGYGITDAFDGDYSSLTNKPTIPPAYTDSDVDTHLNQGTAGAGEVLSWTGADYDWVAQSGGGGLAEVVDDTSPQLGGNLDLNGNQITTSDGAYIRGDDGTGHGLIFYSNNDFKFEAAGGDFTFSNGNLVGINSLAAGTLNNHTIPGGAAGTLALTSDIPAGGGASLPTAVNSQITHSTQNLTGFGAGSETVTAFTTTVTPSSVTSPVFLTINLQASGQPGTGEFGLNLVLKQGGVDVPNSRRLFFIREMNVTYDGTNITYTHTWIPGTTSATLIELWAYNNGGSGGRIGNGLNPIGSISAIVW